MYKKYKKILLPFLQLKVRDVLFVHKKEGRGNKKKDKSLNENTVK